MKFSVWTNPARPTNEVLDFARVADDLGYHGFWFADHYMPNTGSEEFAPGDTHECWALLPAIAAVTEHIRVGPLVSPTSVHHPAVLANRAASLDHVSNGRMVLGLGAGWQINEHRAYGLDLEPPGQRVSRFDEAIQVVRSLLGSDRTTFAGDFYTITDAPCDPKPVQDPLPILVGTASPRMLRITARHADEWNAWGDPGRAGQARGRFEDACAAVDRDPASMWTSSQAMIFITDDDQMAENVKAGPMGDRSIVGPAGSIVEQLGAYVEMGFDEFIVPDFPLGADAAERHDWFARFREDVVDQLADASSV